MNTIKTDLRGAIVKSPFFWMSLPVIAALGLWACGTDSNDEEPTLKIESPANGSTVAGPNVLVRVATTHFSFGAAGAGKVSAAQHDVTGGHVHIWLDNSSRLDGNTVKDLFTADTATISVTTPGVHYLVVGGANANHDDVEGMEDSVSFTVTLP
ncbi:MAG: hypothetical protein JWO30_488 [Fibrobacteres bacterium]|nr:hypothetical protein [Fibrobacterota bacterium]